MGVRVDGKKLGADHEDLTGLLGGDATGHYHLTSGQHADLTSGTATVDSIGVIDCGVPSSDYSATPAIDLSNSFGITFDCGSPTSTYVEV